MFCPRRLRVNNKYTSKKLWPKDLLLCTPDCSVNNKKGLHETRQEKRKYRTTLLFLTLKTAVKVRCFINYPTTLQSCLIFIIKEGASLRLLYFALLHRPRACTKNY